MIEKYTNLNLNININININKYESQYKCKCKYKHKQTFNLIKQKQLHPRELKFLLEIWTRSQKLINTIFLEQELLNIIMSLIYFFPRDLKLFLKISQYLVFLFFSFRCFIQSKVSKIKSRLILIMSCKLYLMIHKLLFCLLRSCLGLRKLGNCGIDAFKKSVEHYPFVYVLFLNVIKNQGT